LSRYLLPLIGREERHTETMTYALEAPPRDALPATVRSLLNALQAEGGDVDLEARSETIVRLHRAGCTYREIAVVFNISKTRVQQVYHAATRAEYERDIKEHRMDLYADLKILVEALRPFVHTDGNPPHKDDVAGFLRAEKALALLLGLEAPKATTVTPVLSATVDNPIAARYVADLAAWIEKHQAISVPGNVRPPLPPGMTERLMIEPSTNGHVHVGPHGQGMWSMVVAFPREEDPTENVIREFITTENPSTGA